MSSNHLKAHMGLSENSVPLHPMVLLIIIPTKWLFHWGYTPFSDIPTLVMKQSQDIPRYPQRSVRRSELSSLRGAVLESCTHRLRGPMNLGIHGSHLRANPMKKWMIYPFKMVIYCYFMGLYSDLMDYEWDMPSGYD